MDRGVNVESWKEWSNSDDYVTKAFKERLGKTFNVPCDPLPGAEEACLHGGSCVEDADRLLMKLGEVSLASCRWIDNWIGARCEARIGFALMNLGPMNEADVYRANVAALMCVVALFVVIGLITTFVYIRYRRKKKVMVDHAFRATAEDLYRRPFNNRSSIVESLSRLNSVRRSGNGRDSPPPVTAAGITTADLGTGEGSGQGLETDAIVIHTSSSSEVLKNSSDVRNLLTVPDSN